MDIFDAYSHTFMAMGCLALLMFVQLLIADVVGIRSKHIPGSSVPQDHGNLLFRASRVVANTNESIAIFILAVTFCIAAQASTTITSWAACAFVIMRLLYAICYYLNFQIMRSVIFGFSLLSLLALLVTGLLAW